MYAGKPIIGIAGGIGSGKSFVSSLFGELGCLVVDSDEQARECLKAPAVKQTLRRWWGDEILGPNGEIDRAAVARAVFAKPQERQRLEQLIHPLVNQARQELMRQHAHDAQVVAFVWDTPLLFETELNRQCDAVVFVETPLELRRARVSQTRRWSPAELESRENSQLPLDSKREMSDYVISNTAGADQVRAQVRQVLSRILAGMTPIADPQ